MKDDKKQFLDDSIRYLGKQIDPFGTQKKKEVNFKREILLADAGIKPESRVYISKEVI